MSRTIRTYLEVNDGDITNQSKDKNPRKSFVYRGDGWATKAQGGPGNKRAWKSYMPKWYYKKNKQVV